MSKVGESLLPTPLLVEHGSSVRKGEGASRRRDVVFKNLFQERRSWFRGDSRGFVVWGRRRWRQRDEASFFASVFGVRGVDRSTHTKAGLSHSQQHPLLSLADRLRSTIPSHRKAFSIILALLEWLVPLHIQNADTVTYRHLVHTESGQAHRSGAGVNGKKYM